MDWTVLPEPSEGGLEATVDSRADAPAPPDDGAQPEIEAGERDGGVDADAAPLDARADVEDASDGASMVADADATVADADATVVDVPCSASIVCPDGTYCRYPDHGCGAGGWVGTCVARPTSCADASLAPSCGCDGVVHASECAVRASGTDLALAGCSAPPDAFACGHLYCRTDEYCLTRGSGLGATYECRPAGGCSLCLCLDGLLSCLGGSCSTSGGNLSKRCP